MPGSNILHKYSSYNAVFTLSALSFDEINNPVSFKNGTPIRNIIARSSGIGTIENAQLDVSKALGEFDSDTYGVKVSPGVGEFLAVGSNLDLFIDDVEIDSAMSFNERSKNTNVTGLQFVLKEMYSVDFIQRLATAAFSLGSNNYLTHPFMLTIQWKGFKRDPDNPNKMIETTTPEAKKLERRIPFTFFNISTNITNAGASYNCQGVPYPDIALRNQNNQKVEDGEIVGNTVGEMLTNMQDTLNTNAKKSSSRLVANADAQFTNIASNKPNKYTILIKDLADGTDYVPIREAAIDLGQASAKSSEASIQPNNTTAPANKNPNQKNRLRLTSTNSITSVITDIMHNSAYCRKFFDKNFTDTYDNNGEITWFKIKTYTKIIDNNDVTGDKQYEFIYIVHPYKVHVSNLFDKIPNINLTSLYRYIKENIARTYNYIYTGANQDILSFDIELNNLFAVNKNFKKGFEAETYALVENNYQIFSNIKGFSNAEKNQKGQLLPGILGFQDIGETTDVTTPTSNLTQRAYDFYTYLVNPQGDLVNMQLEIIGDPFYIEESWNYIDNYSQTTASNGATIEALRDSRSTLVVYKDGGDVYVDLQFRYPDDRFSQNKGLPQDKKLFFSGIYKITQVRSMFSGGKFTQTLQCSKMRGDVYDQTSAPAQQALPIGINELMGGRTPQFGQLNATYSTLVQDMAQYYKDVFANSEIGNKLSEVINEYGPYANDIQQIVNDPKTALINIAEREATDKAQSVLDDYLESTGAKQGGVNVKISDIKKII
jgi:hypothetical protein